MNVGDRIKYTSGYFGDYNTNPLWHGKHGCIIGTITGIIDPYDGKNGPWYEVKWDNDETNGYYRKDIEIESEIDTMFDEIIDNL